MDYSNRPEPFDARMCPRQTAGALEGGYGFIFESRIIKYATWDEAMLAANCLGLDPWFQPVVAPVQVIFPEKVN